MSFMTREDTAFVVIDFQEKLMPAMSGRELLEDRTVRLVKGMKTLEIPTIVTQQYTKGIGSTIPSIAEALGEYEPIDKTTFSCMKNEEFIEKFRALDRKNIVVCGIEAHICVQQTVLQLIEDGYNVFVPADCVSSRSPEDKMWSISRMGEAGAVITSYEAVLYEILVGSKEQGFKQISAIVK